VNTHHHGPSQDNPLVHHEESDVNISAILKFGAGLLAAAAVIHVAIWGLLLLLDRTQSSTTVDFPIAAGETRTPPGPQLQVTPRDDMRALIEQDEAALTSYGWVDRELGVVRIPIEVAMRLTLERGLPSRDADAAAPPATENAGTSTP
jgi:hypothetical protein